MTSTMPKPEWRKNIYGQERQALFLGGLSCGEILQWRPTRPPEEDKRNGQWRGWFMSDIEGAETGWFATADEARASVEAALTKALE